MSIELKNVTYTYSPGTSYEIHALKDINLNIPDGQFIGVIGHTGSGKSTLIQHLTMVKMYGQRTIIDAHFEVKSVWCFSIRSISFLKVTCFRMSALDR